MNRLLEVELHLQSVDVAKLPSRRLHWFPVYQCVPACFLTSQTLGVSRLPNLYQPAKYNIFSSLIMTKVVYLFKYLSATCVIFG